MVQTVSASGLVTLATNNGQDYAVGSGGPPPQLIPTSISLVAPPEGGGFGGASTFQVQLTTDGQGVSGQQVALQVGGVLLYKNTDSNGNASFSVPLEQAPGSYTVNASYAGSSTYAASFTQPASFQITPGATTLTLTTPSVTTTYGSPIAVLANLTNAQGQPITQRAVLFTATSTSNGQTYQTSGITNYAGNAQFGSLAVPAGTYTVTAAFGGQIANGQVTETDADYQPSTAPGAAALTVAQASQAITFGALPNHTVGDAPFTVSASASSGLPVSFSAGPSTVCTSGGTNGATITLVGSGTCTVTASQAGNGNYLAAPNVPQSFTVAASSKLTLALTVTTTPSGPVTTGSEVTAKAALTNHTASTQTVTGSITLKYTGTKGTFSSTGPISLTIKAGQTLTAGVQFTIKKSFPRGTYSVTATAKDGSGDTANASAALTVI
jgi:hypothetical protein